MIQARLRRITRQLPLYIGTLISCFILGSPANAAPAISFPTENRLLLESGQEERFFVGTVGKPWMSGAFGCVRSGGNQFHEGIDIKCLKRDKKGESTDSVFATADGTVTYINTRPSLSNYGNYLVIRHNIDGMEIYSLYAHLKEIRAGLKTGATIKAGETIAVLGRTTNTREGIARERAHLHFELGFLANDRFATWYKVSHPGQRNDHGEWNGQNLIGIDPTSLLIQQNRLGNKFNLVDLVRTQTELCRVMVRKQQFQWIKRYAPLILPNPIADKEGVAGFELAISFSGIPYKITPRAASEIKGAGKYQILSVNETEQKKNPARNLVVKKKGRWELAPAGINLLDLLTF